MDFLKGIRVLSFNHFLMGPMGVQFLADLGADVIAVEPPGGAFQRSWAADNKYVDGVSTTFLSAGRNKRSIAINLRDSAGREIAHKLVASADVLTENYRPGVMARLGLGIDEVRAIKPDIIYAAASGFGPDGPYYERPGQDLILQALSGFAKTNGRGPHDARAAGVSAIDHHGAALFALGVIAALFGRTRTQQGCRVDVSLLSAALDLQAEGLTSALNGKMPDDIGQPGATAGWYQQGGYGIFRAKDGHMAVSLATLKALEAALDEPALAAFNETERFPKREAISDIVEQAVARFLMAELKDRFTTHDVWHAPVNDYEDLVQDPQVIHNRHFVQQSPAQGGAPLTLLTHPVRYDGKAPEIRLPPQPIGAQSESILTELGYSADRIGELIASGVVRGSSAETVRAGDPVHA